MRTLIALLALALPALSQTSAQLNAEIVALKAQVTALSVEIAAIQKQASSIQIVDVGQAGSISALKAQVATILASQIWALNPFLTVDPNPENGVAGPNVVLTGVNLHVVNGMGQTAMTNGLGSIFIGYNELPVPFMPRQRGGSHNLVMGTQNSYTINCYSSIISGWSNYVNGWQSYVLGGEGNVLNENADMLLNTCINTVTGEGAYNVIAGGYCNQTGGSAFSTWLGGSTSSGTPADYTVTIGPVNNQSVGVTGIPAP